MAVKTRYNLNGMSEVEKTAALLISLDEVSASKVMQRLGPETLERVSIQIAKMEKVSGKVKEKVLRNFYDESMARKFEVPGGFDKLKQLLKHSVEPNQAKEIISHTERVLEKPFAFLRHVEAKNLLTFIKDEHPQSIAVIMSHMSGEKAAEILAGLPQRLQMEVVKRISNLDQINAEAIKLIEESLRSRIAAFIKMESVEIGGPECAADMLNQADRVTGKSVLDNLEEEDPELVEVIKRLMFVFEDVNSVNDRGVQNVIKEIDNEEIATALKSSSEELKEKFFSNMSDRAGDNIKEIMEYMGPVRVADVEAAQQRIVDVVRRLEESGDAIIQGKGGDGDVI